MKDITSADILHIVRSTVKRVRETGKRGSGEVTALNNQKFIGAIMRYSIATLRADNDPTYWSRSFING